MPTSADSIKILMSDDTLEKIKTYKTALENKSKKAGYYFSNITQQIKKLYSKDLMPDFFKTLSIYEFTELLIQSKQPKFFAESDFQTNDWTEDEFSILGDLSFTIPNVSVYDNGQRNNPKIYENSINMSLLFVSGAVLAKPRELDNYLPDHQEIVKAGKIDQEAFDQFYERRLLPGLKAINDQAAAAGKKVFVTLAGIGAGAFGGDFGTARNNPAASIALQNTLITLLKKHAGELTALTHVYFDPYRADLVDEKDGKIVHINFKTHPLLKYETPQLTDLNAYGLNPDEHIHVKIVAADPCSWLGNDAYINSRSTDEGVVGCATNIIEIMTGQAGEYQEALGNFKNAGGYRSWEEVVKQHRLVFPVRNIHVYKGSEFYALQDNDLIPIAEAVAPEPIQIKVQFRIAGNGEFCMEILNHKGEAAPQMAAAILEYLGGQRIKGDELPKNASNPFVICNHFSVAHKIYMALPDELAQDRFKDSKATDYHHLEKLPPSEGGEIAGPLQKLKSLIGEEVYSQGFFLKSPDFDTTHQAFVTEAFFKRCFNAGEYKADNVCPDRIVFTDALDASQRRARLSQGFTIPLTLPSSIFAVDKNQGAVPGSKNLSNLSSFVVPPNNSNNQSTSYSSYDDYGDSESEDTKSKGMGYSSYSDY